MLKLEPSRSEALEIEQIAIVRRHQHADASMREFDDSSQHLLPSFSIDASKWFVEDQEIGIAGSGGRKDEPTTHPNAVCTRKAVEGIAQA